MKSQSEVVRVLLLVDSLFVGGTERHVLTLLKGLQNCESIETILNIVNPGGPLDEEAISLADQFFALDRRSCSNFTLLPRYITQSKLLQSSLVHTYGWMSNFLGLCVARSSGIPIINGSIRNVTPHIWHHRISRSCALFSDAIVANSWAGLRAYRLRQHPKAHVIHNGIDLTRFDTISSGAAGCDDQFTICMVGNFSDKKDHATVVRALADVLPMNSDARLIFVGRDAGTLASMRNLVFNLEVEGSVEFVNDCDQPEQYVATSDVCVLLSPMGEGISNALLEYMALSKAVIATDCGGNREVVEPEETGFLIPLGSKEALVEKIRILMQDVDLRRRMGCAGRRRVEKHFSLDAMISQYVRLYHSLVSMGKGAAPTREDRLFPNIREAR